MSMLKINTFTYLLCQNQIMLSCIFFVAFSTFCLYQYLKCINLGDKMNSLILSAACWLSRRLLWHSAKAMPHSQARLQLSAYSVRHHKFYVHDAAKCLMKCLTNWSSCNLGWRFGPNQCSINSFDVTLWHCRL